MVLCLMNARAEVTPKGSLRGSDRAKLLDGMDSPRTEHV
jgi:hypothetical protein